MKRACALLVVVVSLGGAAAVAQASPLGADGVPTQVLGTSGQRFTAQALGENARGDAVAVWEEGGGDSVDDTLHYAIAPAGQPFGPSRSLGRFDFYIGSVAASVSAGGQIVVAMDLDGPGPVYATRGSVQTGLAPLQQISLPGTGYPVELTATASARRAAVGWVDDTGVQVVDPSWGGPWGLPVDPIHAPATDLDAMVFSASGRLRLAWDEEATGGSGLYETYGAVAMSLGVPTYLGGGVVLAADGTALVAHPPSESSTQTGRLELTDHRPGHTDTSRTVALSGASNCDAAAEAPDGRAVYAFNEEPGFDGLVVTQQGAFGPLRRLRNSFYACPEAAAIADSGPAVVLSDGLGAQTEAPHLTWLGDGAPRTVALVRTSMDVGAISVDGRGHPTVMWSSDDTPDLYAQRLR